MVHLCYNKVDHVAWPPCFCNPNKRDVVKRVRMIGMGLEGHVPLCPEIYRVVISSSLANGSTFIIMTSSRITPLPTYYQFHPSTSLPTSSPSYCTGSLHVSIRRPELAYYHYDTLNPSPWRVVLQARFLSQRHSLARFSHISTCVAFIGTEYLIPPQN